jgi:hypothetical protein
MEPGNAVSVGSGGKKQTRKFIRIMAVVLVVAGVAVGGYFLWDQVTRVPAADWALSDFVNDGALIPDWSTPNLLGDPIVAIRDFNRTLPEDERIEVHGIDIHLPDYGGTKSWLTYVDYIAQHAVSDPGPLAAFLQGDHDTYESHRALLETPKAELEEGRSELTAWAPPMLRRNDCGALRASSGWETTWSIGAWPLQGRSLCSGSRPRTSWPLREKMPRISTS